MDMTTERIAAPPRAAAFEIADDFERTGPGQTNTSPAVTAVIEGHTVFLPGARQHGMAGRFARARARGLLIRTRKGSRDGVEGVYVWADKPQNGESPR